MSDIMGNIIDSCLDKYSYGACVGDDRFECTVIDDDDFELLRDRIVSKFREELLKLTRYDLVDGSACQGDSIEEVTNGDYVRRVDVLEMFKVVDSE